MRALGVVFLATTALSAGAEWDSLKVTYGMPGNPGFYDLPVTVEEAVAQQKWQKIGEDRSVHADIYSQPDDPHFMMLYDTKGQLAGVRMAVLVEGMDKKAKEGGYPFTVDYDNNPAFEKGNYFGKDLYHATVLLQHPKTLAAGGRKSFDRSKEDIAEGVFFKYDGKWTEVGRDECKLDKNLFYEANCWEGMGDHYPLRNGNEDDCAHRHSFKQTLFSGGRLIGFVMSGFGAHVEKKNSRAQDYYENLPIEVTKAIMPKAPACLGEYGKRFGVLNMHVYLTKNASKLPCPSPKWSSKC